MLAVLRGIANAVAPTLALNSSCLVVSVAGIYGGSKARLLFAM